MSNRPDRRDRARQTAAMLFAGATVYGSVVAVRHDLPGRPLGVSLPISVRTAILAGWGAGVAAPWLLPTAALAASRPGLGPSAGAVCTGVGVTCIAGTLMEPVTYRYGNQAAPVRAAIALNLSTATGLCLSGIRHIQRMRQARP